MAESKKQFTPEFRAEAVRLTQSSGRPHREIAADLRIQSSRPRCCGPQTQHAPEKNPWLPDTKRYPRHSRCADRLNPPRLFSPRRDVDEVPAHR